MQKSRIGLAVFSIMLLGLWLITGSAQVGAQGTISDVFITGSDSSAAPSVDLYIFAMDGRGNNVDLTGQQFVIKQDGATISEWELAGTHTGGTMTIFIIDIPEGVSSFIPVIQELITKYASDSYMMEENDYVGIYRVDELGATELLAPDSFHNSVLNTFASPPAPTTGATALIDSVVNLLNNIESMKPDPNIPVHIVVISDGTDTVSTQFEPDDLPRRASELGIPVHTIWLDNDNLSGERERAGQQYLSQVASGTRGESANLSTADQLTTLWDKISSFRNQTILRYTADKITGGDHNVEVSLPNSPGISAETSFSIAPGAPQISFDIPEDSREITLESLDQPIQLTFSTLIEWPDDGERTLSSAVLQVNGILAQTIDVTQIESFDAAIDSLKYGDNRFQIVAIDDQGHRVATPEVVMTILKGETVIPEAVSPTSPTDRMLDRFRGYGKYVAYCLLALVVIVVLIVIVRLIGRRNIPTNFRIPYFLRRVPIIGKFARQVDRVRYKGQRVSRYKRDVSRYAPDVQGLDRQGGKDNRRPSAFLEVVQSSGQSPGRIDLDVPEVRLGRSSKRADIAFSGDSTVSRLHATIVQEGGVHRVFDEQSTSGTFVNEQRVHQNGLQLVDGDEIRLGAVLLKYRQP